MFTNGIIAYALGAVVLIPFLLCLLLFVPGWGKRSMPGYGPAAVRIRPPWHRSEARHGRR